MTNHQDTSTERELLLVPAMLDAYIEAIKASGEYERWHYIPEVESARDAVAQSLAALASRDEAAQQPQGPSAEDVRELSKWLNEEVSAPINRQALARVLAAQQPQGQELQEMHARKDAAYLERNQVVAALASQPAQDSKAQEGREPVARVELMTTGGNVGIATRIVEIDDPLRERLSPGALLYTSPPPKSDEANAELVAALTRISEWASHEISMAVDYGSDGVRDFYRRIASDALATQQKGGAV